MRGFLRALQFLTIVRIREESSVTGEEMGASMAYFPLVGLLAGLILAGIRALLAMVLPPALTDMLVIVTLVIITGALHLDGFADTIDGLAGGGDREKTLAIMKDSRIGSFAVIGLILLLALKIFALIEVPQEVKYCTLIVMPVTGRWSTVQLASFFPYARSGPGTAEAFVRFAGKLEYLVATVMVALIVIGLFRMYGVLILVVTALFTGVFGLFFKKRIGGVTGDIMGAACELSEVMTLLVICSVFV